MSLLNVHTAAMLTKSPWTGESIAVPLPQTYFFASVADNPLKVIGVNMTCLVRKSVFLHFAAIVAALSEKFIAVGLVSVIADMDSIGVPVFVAHFF